MDILKVIAEKKRKEVKVRKKTKSIAALELMPSFLRKTYSIKQQIMAADSTGIIAEFKHQSPSKGIINQQAVAQDVAKGYENAGVSAISVLTESNFFGGCDQDLIDVRNATTTPILRKDFTIDIFQIAEAKALGADAVLLIASLLDKAQLHDFFQYAREIGLEALVEVHHADELEKLPEGVELVGVNSRNLSNFEVDLKHSASIINLLPSNAVKIAESGIHSISDYFMLKEIGFNGFLMGEIFMKEADPADACLSFSEAVKHAKNSERQLS